MLTRIPILFLLSAVLAVGSALGEQTPPATPESPGVEDSEAPQSTEPKVTEDPDQTAPRTSRERAVELTRDPDIRVPQLRYTTTLFDRPLAFGANYEVRPRYRVDFALGQRDDDDFFLIQRASLQLLYGLASNVAIFLQAKGSYRANLYAEDGDKDSDGKVERGQTWLFADNLWGSDFGLQVGRQRLFDRREWWWDQDLDALRLHYHPGGGLRFSLAVAEELGDTSTDELGVDVELEDVLRIFGHARWKWGEKQRIEALLLAQNDHSGSPSIGEIVDRKDAEDELDQDMIWFGARATGRVKLSPKHGLYYWLDAGGTIGEETALDFDSQGKVEEKSTRDVRGWGLDVGASWKTRWPLKPAFTLGYAFGSGESNPDRGTDNSYRQTGLQDNNGKFRGANRFRYYGELLRPELSNLHIGTVSLGFPLLEDSSVELVYHWYRQVHTADFLRDSEIRVRPLGQNKDIGHEVDLVLGLEEWERLEIELVGALFFAGNAYGPLDGETAGALFMKIQYSF